MRLVLALAVAGAACHPTKLQDKTTGYSVHSNERYTGGIGMTYFGVIPIDGDHAERGAINPAVIEYIFAAPEGPFARYYDLVLALAADDRPRDVVLDLQTLEPGARAGLPPGAKLRGRDYARALGRKLVAPINEALSGGLIFRGTAGVYWGMPVDLDAGIPLLDYERDGVEQMRNSIFRYEKAAMILLRSSATHELFAWDVSELPGAFDANAHLDAALVAAHVVALHARTP